jgi:hypothetical protein
MLQELEPAGCVIDVYQHLPQHLQDWIGVAAATMVLQSVLCLSSLHTSMPIVTM